MTFLDFSVIAGQITEWVSLGLFLLLIYYGWLIIKGGSEGSTHREAWGAGKVGWDKLKKLPSGAKNLYNKLPHRAKKAARKEKTRTLDEYISEKNELHLLDEALDHAEEFDSNAKGFAEGKVSLKDLRNNFKELKESTTEAEKEVSRLKSRTFRQERQYHKLRKALEEAEMEISSAEKQKMEAYEHDLLYQHRLVVNSMKKVNAGLSNAVSELRKNKTDMDTKGLQKVAAIIHKELGNARASQEQAYKECESLIAMFKKYWK